MPKYFFDIYDGEQQIRDDTGVDLSGPDAARDAAIGVLPNIARDELPDGDKREFVAVVRDESGRKIFRAALSLVAEWL